MRTTRRRIDTGTDCDISLCGAAANEHVEHPQRGEMEVCGYHARQIIALPAWRFIGQEVAR